MSRWLQSDISASSKAHVRLLDGERLCRRDRPFTRRHCSQRDETSCGRLQGVPGFTRFASLPFFAILHGGATRCRLRGSSITYIFSVFLSRFEKYPSTKEKAKMDLKSAGIEEWKAGQWTYRVVADILAQLDETTGLRAVDPTFELSYVAVSVESYLKQGKPLGILNFKEPKPQKRIRLLKHRMNRGGSKVVRCRPEALDPNSISLHAPQYDAIKEALLADISHATGSTAIAALGASRGVGKTWMARRLAYDEEVVNFFPD